MKLHSLLCGQSCTLFHENENGNNASESNPAVPLTCRDEPNSHTGLHYI